MNIQFSLILACFNEETHLEKSFQTIISVLNKTRTRYEIIFVDDKSQDQTLQIIKEIIKKHPKVAIKLLAHSRNQGRGKSVSDGLMLSRGNLVGYLDVDLEISPKYIPQALKLLAIHDVVTASRSYNFSFSTIHRFLATKIYAFLVCRLLHLPVNDTEAGFKFFRRKKILPVLKKAKNPGWFWDTEIVFYANQSGSKLVNLPVKYIRRTDKKSTVHTLTDSVDYLVNLIKLVKQDKINF